MKKFLVLVFSFLSVFANAQVLQLINNYGTEPNRIKPRLYLGIPQGLGSNNIAQAGYDTANIRYNVEDSSLYIQTGSQWLKVGGGGVPFAENGLTKTGDVIELGGTWTKNTAITGDYTKYLSIDGLSEFVVAANAISLNGATQNYMYGDWEVDGLLKGFTDLDINDSAMFHGYGLLDKKFNYSGNIHSTFDDYSLIDKSFLDSVNVLNASWKLTGNSGTSDATNFIGTKDNVPFNIRVNNQKSGRIDPTLVNTSYGYLSLSSNTDGQYNTAIGGYALNNNTTGIENTAIGVTALDINTTGSYNTAIGRNALHLNSTGTGNTATGFGSSIANQTGNYNASFGTNSLLFNTSGSYNSAFGLNSLKNVSTGNYNTGFGYLANVSNGALINATAIGANSYVTASNSLVLGSINGTNGAISDSKVGIGITAPTEKLHIVGNLRLVNGSQGVGKVLTSDANGLSSWSAITGADISGFSTKVTKDGDNGPLTIGSNDATDFIFETNNSARWTIDGPTGYLRKGSGTAVHGLQLYGTGVGSVLAFGDNFGSVPYVGIGEKGLADTDQLEAYGQKGFYVTTGTYGSTSSITVQQDGDVIIGGETQVAGAELTVIGDTDISGNLTAGNIILGSASLNFPSTVAGAVSDLTITATGAALNDPVFLGVPNGSVTSTATYWAWVSSANTVTVRFSPKATEDPATGTFKIKVFK